MYIVRGVPAGESDGVCILSGGYRPESLTVCVYCEGVPARESDGVCIL